MAGAACPARTSRAVPAWRGPRSRRSSTSCPAPAWSSSAARPSDGTDAGPPAGAPLARPRRGRRDRHRLRPSGAARRGRRPRLHDPRRGAPCRSTSTTTPRTRSTPRSRSSTRSWSTAGVERERAARRRRGPAGPDRPRDRHGRLVGDPARLGRPSRRRTSSRRASACRSTSTTTRTSARSASPTFGAGRGATEMAYVHALGRASAPGSSSAAGSTAARAGIAGEIGHVLVDEHGPICRCGNRGCLETSRRRRALAATCCAAQHGDALTVAGLVRLARDGDAGCQRVIADAGRVVGRAAATLCNVLNPDAGRRRRRARRGRRRCCSTRCARRSVRYAIPAAAEDVRDRRRRAGRARRGARRARLALGRSDRVADEPRAAPRAPGDAIPDTARSAGRCSRNELATKALIASGRTALALAVGPRGLLGSDDSSSSSDDTSAAAAARGRRQGRQGRGAAAGHEVVGPLGDGRPAAAEAGVRRRGRARRRSRTPRATSPPSSSRPSRRSPTARRCCCSSNLDSGSGAAIEANAKSQGVKVIDYDRLTLKGARRLLRVVRQRGGRQAAGPGPRRSAWADRPSKPTIAELNGSPTDNNATLFAQGYNSVLEPAVQGGRGQEGRRPVRARLGQPEGADDLRADAAEGEQQDRRRARGQRRPRQRGHLGAQGAQAASRSRSPARTRPPQGIQNILAGDQCMTVYKASRRRPTRPPKLAIALAKGSSRPPAWSTASPTTRRARSRPSC